MCFVAEIRSRLCIKCYTVHAAFLIIFYSVLRGVDILLIIDYIYLPAGWAISTTSGEHEKPQAAELYATTQPLRVT